MKGLNLRDEDARRLERFRKSDNETNIAVFRNLLDYVDDLERAISLTDLGSAPDLVAQLRKNDEESHKR